MAITNYSGGGGSPASFGSYKKGLGFFPSSIQRYFLHPIADLLHKAPKIAQGQCALSGLDASYHESEATIPLFDLQKIVDSPAEERSRLVQAFGIALSQAGFIGITADRIAAIQDRATEEMKKYFHRELSQKIIDWDPLNRFQGYSPKGMEWQPKALWPDHKETYFITAGIKSWPQHSRSFSRVMSEYYPLLHHTSRQVLQLIFEYLGEDSEEVGDMLRAAPNLMRLTYSSALKPGDNPKGLWESSRVDPNVITLSTPGTVPGIQFFNNHKQWQMVRVPKDYLIVNTGMSLQQKTAGLIQARWHRVVNPNGRYTRLERFSTSFEACWETSFPLSPFSKCLELATRGMPEKRRKKYQEHYSLATV